MMARWFSSLMVISALSAIIVEGSWLASCVDKTTRRTVYVAIISVFKFTNKKYLETRDYSTYVYRYRLLDTTRRDVNIRAFSLAIYGLRFRHFSSGVKKILPCNYHRRSQRKDSRARAYRIHVSRLPRFNVDVLYTYKQDQDDAKMLCVILSV